MMADTAYFHSKRKARYSMMPSTTKASALRPSVASSSPTCGPTNSVRRSVAVSSCAFSAAITLSLCCAELTPFCAGSRISTSREVPKFCTCTSVKPWFATVLRRVSTSTLWL